MLPKENRLRKNRDFQSVQKNGRYYYGSFLAIKVLNNDNEETRVGIIATNKIFNNVPERNKTRRRIREILRGRMKLFKKGLDVIFILKKGISKKSFKDLAEAVDGSIERAGLIKNS